MLYFIINPKSKSGHGLTVWNIVKHELDKRKIKYTYYVTTRKAHATKFAAQICEKEEKIHYIIAVGGDGTVNEIINGIPNYSKVILGYIPTGSGNDLAKGLCIPTKPLDALQRILDSKKFIYVDHGEMTLHNSSAKEDIIQRFCTSTGIGLDASICIRGLNSKLKYWFNKVGLSRIIYATITLSKIIQLKLVDADVTIDGNKHHFEKVAFITSLIHKSEGGGLKMAPKAKYNDRKLSVFMIHGMSKVKLLMCLAILFIGKRPKFTGVTTFDCTTIDIKTSDVLPVHIDGKLAGTTNHLTNTIYSKAIRMPR